MKATPTATTAPRAPPKLLLAPRAPALACAVGRDDAMLVRVPCGVVALTGAVPRIDPVAVGKVVVVFLSGVLV